MRYESSHRFIGTSGFPTGRKACRGFSVLANSPPLRSARVQPISGQALFIPNAAKYPRIIVSEPPSSRHCPGLTLRVLGKHNGTHTYTAMYAPATESQPASWLAKKRQRAARTPKLRSVCRKRRLFQNCAPYSKASLRTPSRWTQNVETPPPRACSREFQPRAQFARQQSGSRGQCCPDRGLFHPRCPSCSRTCSIWMRPADTSRG